MRTGLSLWFPIGLALAWAAPWACQTFSLPDGGATASDPYLDAGPGGRHVVDSGTIAAFVPDSGLIGIEGVDGGGVTIGSSADFRSDFVYSANYQDGTISRIVIQDDAGLPPYEQARYAAIVPEDNHCTPDNITPKRTCDKMSTPWTSSACGDQLAMSGTRQGTSNINSPSRTIVDRKGNVVVALRAPGTGCQAGATRIIDVGDHLNTCHVRCPNRTGLAPNTPFTEGVPLPLASGGTVTILPSTPPAAIAAITPGTIYIEPQNVIAAGTSTADTYACPGHDSTDETDPVNYDDCLDFSVALGDPNPDPNADPDGLTRGTSFARAAAISPNCNPASEECDTFIGMWNGHSWVHLSSGANPPLKLFDVVAVDTLPHSPYGGAVDCAGVLWSQGFSAIDGTTTVPLALPFGSSIPADTVIADIPNLSGCAGYGIATDVNERVWIGSSTTGPEICSYNGRQLVKDYPLLLDGGWSEPAIVADVDRGWQSYTIPGDILTPGVIGRGVNTDLANNVYSGFTQSTAAAASINPDPPVGKFSVAPCVRSGGVSAAETPDFPRPPRGNADGTEVRPASRGSSRGGSARGGGPVDGACGPCDGVGGAIVFLGSGQCVSSGTLEQLCSGGSASAVSGFGTWSCEGSSGGANASCSAALAAGGPSNAACGSCDGAELAGPPGDLSSAAIQDDDYCIIPGPGDVYSVGTLCATGVLSSISGGGPWSWTCTGFLGAGTVTTTDCSASLAIIPPPINGACGSADGTALRTAPAWGLCKTGTPSVVSGAGPWTWACAGSNGGTNASCSASVEAPPINGVCGSEAAVGSSVAYVGTLNLCNSGVATYPNSEGPFDWLCIGEYGGTSADCEVPLHGYLTPGVCGTGCEGADLSPGDGVEALGGCISGPGGSVWSPLCDVGVSSVLSTAGGVLVWTCTGMFGGVTPCAATLTTTPMDAVCGTCAERSPPDVGLGPLQEPNVCTTDLGSVGTYCSTGEPVSFDGLSWVCGGLNGGANVTCGLGVSGAPTNGACGSENGATLSTAPSSSGLCSAGPASAVSGTGPWTWTCAGSGGGTTASCSASLANPVCVDKNGDPTPDGGLFNWVTALPAATYGGSTVGVDLDNENNLWLGQLGQDGAHHATVARVDGRTGSPLASVDVGSSVYTYSDFTGYALRHISLASSTYSQTFAGCGVSPELTLWQTLGFRTELPAGTDTSLSVTVTNSNDPEILAAATPYPVCTSLNAGCGVGLPSTGGVLKLPSSLPQGKYLTVYATLVPRICSIAGGSTATGKPILYSLNTTELCPGD